MRTRLLTIFAKHGIMAHKPMKTLELHYPMIQFLINKQQSRLLVLSKRKASLICLLSDQEAKALGTSISRDHLNKITLCTTTTDLLIWNENHAEVRRSCRNEFCGLSFSDPKKTKTPILIGNCLDARRQFFLFIRDIGNRGTNWPAASYRQ